MNVTIVALVAVITLIYWLVKNRFNYWKKKGVVGPKPNHLTGTCDLSQNLIHYYASEYQKFKGKGPYCGLINFFKPVALALDPEFIKDILVRDFKYFPSRGLYYNERDDPLTAHLFSLSKDRWRNLRGKLSPTFTSGKMKYMFNTVRDVADQLKLALNNWIKTTSSIDVKEISARFSTDVIGTCAFGLECNSLKDPKAEFRVKTKSLLKTVSTQLLKRFVTSFYPKLSRAMKIKLIPKDISKFFLSALYDTVEYRTKNNVSRNDFMDLLIKLRNEDKSNDLSEIDKEGLSMNEIASQAWIFFLAGLETSSSAMAFALYELAQNEEIQERARNNVKEVLEKHGNEMTYEAIQNMTYLEQCINESLRKYPPLPILPRQVAEDYTVKANNSVLEKDTIVIISVYGIHHDPDYYPNPEVYDPDRFLPEEVEKRNPYTFLAFGEGPRICIGQRFGVMQAKIGLATMLANFKFKLNKKTSVPLKFVKGPILTSEEEIVLDVERL